MTTAQLIYIVGDIHAEWFRFNDWLNRSIKTSKQICQYLSKYDEVEIVILQCGDFGFWPHVKPRNIHDVYGINNQMEGIKDGLIKVYWCDGNHENHDELDILEEIHPGEPFIMTAPGIYFCTFGSILTLLDGTRIMFCGGADSVDKAFRTPGLSWWPQEIIDQKDMLALPNPDTAKVDWIISHTSPDYFEVDRRIQNYIETDDPSKHLLSGIFDDYHPRRWWYAHFHEYHHDYYQDCEWTMLGMIIQGDSQWSEQLPPIVVEDETA